MAEVVELKCANGDFVQVNLFGATITSWKCFGHKEMLFLSQKAILDGTKAIRGGIPIVFPNFGPWDLGPQHGFARISKWSVADKINEGEFTPSGSFVLEDSDFTRKMWNYRFRLTYRVTIAKQKLSMELSIENKDDKPFDFTTLLHTYFRLPDVTKTTVSGLSGLTYIDKVKDGQTCTETRDKVSVECHTDRVYVDTPNSHHLSNSPCNNDVVLEKSNLPDTVVWNPWQEKAKAMSDFWDNEYPNMLCVEAGYVSKRHVLEPGKTFQCGQTLTCTA